MPDAAIYNPYPVERQNNIGLLGDKSHHFALRVIKAYKYLRKKKELVLSNQLLRAGTSIGANCREAIYAQSKADFVNKLSISLKEATETKYWLELLHESENLNSTQFDSLINDLNIIIGTLVTTIKNTKRNGGDE